MLLTNKERFDIYKAKSDVLGKELSEHKEALLDRERERLITLMVQTKDVAEMDLLAIEYCSVYDKVKKLALNDINKIKKLNKKKREKKDVE